jgi:hypothetical protein
MKEMIKGEKEQKKIKDKRGAKDTIKNESETKK